MFRSALMVVLLPLVLSGTACIQSVDTKSSAPAVVEVAVPAESPAAEGAQAASGAEQRPQTQAAALRLRVQPLRPTTLPYRVESASPDGMVRLVAFLPEEEAGQLQRMGMSLDWLVDLTEGYYLGVTGMPPTAVSQDSPIWTATNWKGGFSTGNPKG